MNNADQRLIHSSASEIGDAGISRKRDAALMLDGFRPRSRAQ